MAEWHESCHIDTYRNSRIANVYGAKREKTRDVMNVITTEHGMVIRSATEKDLDSVLEIDRVSFPTPWTYNCFKIELKEIFFVVERKKIIGYLVACLCDLGLRAEILRIAVHPDHRGKGIAKKLIEEILLKFAKENVETVELEVNSANRSAVKLYEKFGFKIKKIATFLADQDFHIFYVMKLKLSELEGLKDKISEKRYYGRAYYNLQIAG